MSEVFMFCPKCSQEQVSDETRFCSRCGFQLGVVKALLVSDDSPQLQGVQTSTPDRSLRKRDVTIGALLMFILAFIVAVLTSDLPPYTIGRVVALMVAWFALSLLINIKSIIGFFLQGDASQAKGKSPSDIASGFVSRFEKRTQNHALPTAQSIPAADLVMPSVKTAEIVPPPSVTEPTTNLLDNKQS